MTPDTHHILGLSKFCKPWRHQILSLALHAGLMGWAGVILNSNSPLIAAVAVAGIWELYQIGRGGYPNLLDRARDILHAPMGAAIMVSHGLVWELVVVVALIWWVGLTLSGGPE
jgi:hypothetical protein